MNNSHNRFGSLALLCLLVSVPACAITGTPGDSSPAPPPVRSASHLNSGQSAPPVQREAQGHPGPVTHTQNETNYPIRQVSGEEPIEQPVTASPQPTATQGHPVAYPMHPAHQVGPHPAYCPPGYRHPAQAPGFCGPGGCPPFPGAGYPVPSGYAPGFGQPGMVPYCWPEDEYLFDGGDRDTQVVVNGEFGLHGLHTEDTVGHFDTLDGRREVVPSNRVCVYAPRFAAVRKVYGLEQNEHSHPVVGNEGHLRINSQDTHLITSTANQPLQLGRDIGLHGSNTLQDRQLGLGMEGRQRLVTFHQDFQVYEDLSIIKLGQYDAEEKLRLATGVQNAIAWDHNQAVQVVLDGLSAHESQSEVTPEQVVHYDLPPGKPRLQVVKVASVPDAKPGETVEFTIRFDNVGDQKIGNVTIVDNLTPRLELIEGTAQCSIEATFLTQPNEKGSLVLHWEIAEPLEVGEGGIIRFQCRVR